MGAVAGSRRGRRVLGGTKRRREWRGRGRGKKRGSDDGRHRGESGEANVDIKELQRKEGRWESNAFDWDKRHSIGV
eukprot:5056622-Pleurochrysis_carterae.AAC.1